MRYLLQALLLCACTDVGIIPSDGEGGGGGRVTEPVGGVGGNAGEVSNGGEGGGGGEHSQRTIVVDLDAPEGASRASVVVLLSAPDGTIRETWLGDELPVDAAAEDGDLVTYASAWTYSSHAFMYRVTPEVTEVRSESWLLGAPNPPCNPGPPMTIILDIPALEDANYFQLGVAGGAYLPSNSLHTGLNEAEIVTCNGATTFDLVMTAREFGNTDPIAFARIDDVPFEAGSTLTIPVELGTERTLVDIVVEGEPGLTYGTKAYWSNDSFSNNGMWVETSASHVMGDAGTAQLAYGPFDLGDGFSFVRVSTPPEPFWCEIDSAWKMAPYDDTTLYARFGALAGFAPQPDGNVALAAEGEIGDMMMREENDYTLDVTAYWALYEDPLHPYPMPVKPQVPSELLPDFKWPGSTAESRYIHEDRFSIEGYADYARDNASGADGRSLHRVPSGCSD